MQARPRATDFAVHLFRRASIERIGDLIDRSLWAEMLDDRKFSHDINSKPGPPSAGRGPAGGPGRDRTVEQWRPIGPDECVVMDRHNPNPGEHTPSIQLGSRTANVLANLKTGGHQTFVARTWGRPEIRFTTGTLSTICRFRFGQSLGSRLTASEK